MTATIERGSVVRVRFDPSEGREIRKTRPAVVVSNDIACRFDAVVQVVPISHFPDRELRPYESRVESPGCGLSRPSRLVANQIRTVSRKRISSRLGRIDPTEEAALDRALEIQLSRSSSLSVVGARRDPQIPVNRRESPRCRW